MRSRFCRTLASNFIVGAIIELAACVGIWFFSTRTVPSLVTREAQRGNSDWDDRL